MIGAGNVLYIAQHVVIDCLKLYDGQPHQSRSSVASVRTIETQRNNVFFRTEERDTVMARVKRSIDPAPADECVVPETAVERVVVASPGPDALVRRTCP